ncbi:MAG: hypothetical protein CMO40_03170 [Verrucomicrobiaceae bacterium]|nr:hypothetical protein [Verrucomicrobiaceae bacterium]
MRNTFLLCAFFLSCFGNLGRSAELLKDLGESWDYLLPRDAIGGAIDPERISPSFPDTWMDPVRLGYVDPPFDNEFGPGTGYFGYGTISGSTITTNVWNPGGLLTGDEPQSGQRGAVYFRTTVTPTQPVEAIRFSGIIDDGAIVYFDGLEVARINMPGSAGGPAGWGLLAAAGGSEVDEIEQFVQLNLPADVPIVVAVSVHNSSLTSSDLGFDLRIESLDRITPGNDAFVNATPLGSRFQTVAGTTGDRAGGQGASREDGEPLHAGNPGGGSVWWSWTPNRSGRVSVSTAGSDFSTLLAVYTGDEVGDLQLVSRFASLFVPANSAEEPFHPASRVEFDAVAGTTYHLAVDGADGGFGEILLTIGSAFTPLDPVEELIGAGSEWEWLLALDGTLPVDPELLDVDFDGTWKNSLLYDGPAFQGPDPAPLGYGVLGADPIATDIWGGQDANGNGLDDPAPLSGRRFTTYYRTFFTPAEDVTHVAFEGLVDDGAIIYLDSLEVARMNVAANQNSTDWQAVAVNANPASGNTEDAPQLVFALNQAIQADQEVEIAVSVHNTSGTSSDMGFDLRVWSAKDPLDPPPGPGPDFGLEVNPLAEAGVLEISWESDQARDYRVEFSPDLENWSVITPDLIQGDPGGISRITNSPGRPSGFYRVLEFERVP